MRAEWEPQVYLVGAGPGDPGLLTRRGEEVLRRADVVLHDHLVHRALLDLASPIAERIDVGKRAGAPSPTQESINARMIEEARRGRIVVRLKGGDNFVFGRGGEEAAALLEAGIRFEVVPGVSAAISVPALAGIPITHRGLNSVVHLVTGHEDPDAPGCSVRWDLLAQTRDAIVILMGSRHFRAIAARLVREGMDERTPIAFIQWGSYPRQFSVRSTLREYLKDAEGRTLAPPSITVIGAVAGLAESLNWFERRPLFGRRIILTRPEEGGAAFEESLREAGAAVETIPVIRFEETLAVPAEVWTAELARLRASRGWLILPSPAAIRFFFEALAAGGLDARALGGIRVAVIGERSAEDLASRGIRADFTPRAPNAAALARELPFDAPGQPAMVAGSSRGRPELPDGLLRRGFEVTRRELYLTEPDPSGLATLRRRLSRGDADSIVVFSPLAAAAIHEAISGEDSRLLRSVDWFAIGATTDRALAALNLTPAETADEPTPRGLVEAILRAARGREARAGLAEGAL